MDRSKSKEFGTDEETRSCESPRGHGEFQFWVEELHRSLGRYEFGKGNST